MYSTSVMGKEGSRMGCRYLIGVGGSYLLPVCVCPATGQDEEDEQL